ncbi:MAG: radical SAM protein [Humidesulfovibrio sp.]|nr:radical SAM protein [Humidesulfovibrio sp.]
MLESAVLSATEALCPVCLKRLPATCELRGDAVWLCRVCPEHGKAEAVVWRGAPSFTSWRRAKTPSAPPVTATAVGRGCPYDCGLCPEHGQHTCTAVVEVTQRCNLRCPVCYASASQADQDGAADAPAAELAARLADLRRTAGACNVQLSGGEPTIRDDLPEIIRAARAQGFGLVQLNTNGLRLGREPGYARSLAQAGLQSVFLQFDGPDEACRVLRGRPLLAEKLRALDACAEAGLGVVLVPTLVRGVNDHALGEILALALARAPGVRGVHFQPASSFGRYPGELSFGPDEAKRLTLPEVLTLLVAQSGGMLRAEDFHPPCCEHERCSFSARFALQGGRLMPLSEGGCCDAPSPQPIVAAEGARRAKASVAGQWATAPAPPSQPPRDDFERFLASRGADKRLSISCMAFQDVLTLDLERVRGCCIHTQAPDGRLIPFCLYNLTAQDGTTLYRGRV